MEQKLKLSLKGVEINKNLFHHEDGRPFGDNPLEIMQDIFLLFENILSELRIDVTKK